jgi:hypothetical protein
MEISSTFWILGITNWCRQPEETDTRYVDLLNTAHDIFSITPHGVTVEASLTLVRDVIGSTQSKPQARPFAKRLL